MLRLLLDTNALLLCFSGSSKIGGETRREIGNGKNDVFVSSVSAWEISIKSRIGKLKAPKNLEAVIVKNGFELLPLTFFHAEQAGNLPMNHRDLFDRMLVAQTQAEGLVIVTNDKKISLCNVRTLDVEK